MIVYNGAFGGKKLGAQTYYTPFPAAAGQAQGLYQPYPPGWAPQQAPRIILPPSPAALIVSEAPVPSSMVPAEVPAAAKATSTSPVAGFAIAAAVLGGGALIASLIA